MKVGIPREVKNHEYRVAITPVGVHELVQHGHEVVVEQGAGLGSQIPDEEYTAAGVGIKARAKALKAWTESIRRPVSGSSVTPPS